MASIYEHLLGIALEEDITNQVQDAVTNTLGRGTLSTGGNKNPAGFDGQRDITQTDDIFGLQGQNNPQNDAGENTPDDQMNMNDPNGPDGGMNNPTGEDDMTDEDLLAEGEGIDENSNEPESIYKKNKLRDSMILFYDILKNNIDLITEAMTDINDAGLLETCNKVLANLRSSKDILFDEIDTGLEKHPYEEILRKYIALRRVYDISGEMLEKHFKAHNIQVGLKGMKGRKSKTNK